MPALQVRPGLLLLLRRLMWGLWAPAGTAVQGLGQAVAPPPLGRAAAAGAPGSAVACAGTAPPPAWLSTVRDDIKHA